MNSLMAFSKEVDSWSRIFDQCIVDYHIDDHIDTEMPVPTASEEMSLFYEKCWVDTVQWHLEDEIRKPDINPVRALEMKRRIDKSNQHRTNLVEKLDDLFLERFSKVDIQSDARLNTESPAWAIDRLSILALKIFHMKIEAEREDVDSDHNAQCSVKLQVLLSQKEDLSLSIAQLLEDMQSGKRIMKVYRQMKMYNDPKLNPVLYKAGNAK